MAKAKKKDHPHRLTIGQKLATIRYLYNWVLDNTESFELENIGADLAYLLGAVANGSYCEWDSDRPFVKLLRGADRLRYEDEIMAHIQVVEPSEEG